MVWIKIIFNSAHLLGINAQEEENFILFATIIMDIIWMQK